MFEGDHKFDYFVHAHSLVTHGGFHMSWLVFIQTPFRHWVMQRGLYAKER